MKNIFKIFSLISIFVLLILNYGYNTTQAAQQYGVADPNTFILNNGNDLGKIIPKGVYFTPQIKYTDSEGVKNQFISQINYPGDFYQKRNITEAVADGTDPYVYIDWKKPFYVSSLDGIKRVLKGYLFAYRKSGEIYWMDAQNFTPAFLTGYERANNQSIIIYPIKEKKSQKVLAFMQYPCGNLVCKDTLCTDLKITPSCGDGVTNYELGEQCDPNDPDTRRGCTNQCTYENLSCKIFNSKSTIEDNIRPSVRIQQDRNIDIQEVYLNRTEFDRVNDINRETLEPGRYQLSAKAVNKFSGKEFLCEGSTFTVEGREYCGDGEVNGNEECDFADPNNNGSCNRSCKLIGDSCNIISKQRKIIEESSFTDVVSIRYPSERNKLTKIEINDESINPRTYKFQANGEYNITATIVNDYAGTTNTCSQTITYSEREYCGDGIVNGYEQCDLGSKNGPGSGCLTSCKYEQPLCRIDREQSTINEGTRVGNFLTVLKRGNLETLQIDKKIYNNASDFLNEKVKLNSCGTNRQSVSVTVSNPLNNTITNTCRSTYNVKPLEYCGDGKVSGNEQCDPNDPVSGQFCSEQCKFKEPTECNLISNTLTANKLGNLVIDTNYYASAVKAEIDGRSYTIRDGIIPLRLRDAGKYDMSITVTNKLDRRGENPKICNFNVTVLEEDC